MANQEIARYLSDRREAFVTELSALVGINSVRAAAKPGMPFGEGGAAALGEAARILGAHGYLSVNYGNYALEADLGAAPSLMLLAHLDVVEAGDGWTRPPFSLTREGDTLYGRGVTDDKGPALACLYAMDACRAVLGEPKTGVRLVLGSGEETGSEDMDHYFSRRPKLANTLSPDADYPLINLEKGRFAPGFTKTVRRTGNEELLWIEGGKTPNIVPAKTRCAVTGVSEERVLRACEAVSAKTGVRFETAHTPEGTEILAVGEGAHAAQPQKGNNSQTALILLLLELLCPEDAARETLSALRSLFPHGETDGAGAGVKQADERSGALTLNFGVLSYRDGVFTCGVDIRSPVSATEESVKTALGKRLAGAGFRFIGDPAMRPAHYVPDSSPLVRTLLDVYTAHTGEPGECLAIGGGTYVHDIEGGVAFGVEFPGKDYRIHGADEWADLDELLLTARMYADVIARLCYA